MKSQDTLLCGRQMHPDNLISNEIYPTNILKFPVIGHRYLWMVPLQIFTQDIVCLVYYSVSDKKWKNGAERDILYFSGKILK